MYTHPPFRQIYIPDIISRKKLKTHMQILCVEKVSVSYTQKHIVSHPQTLPISCAALTILTGQRSVVVWALKSVSSWKLRKNAVIGCKVTLRRKAAWVFLNKLYIYGLYTPMQRKTYYFFMDKGLCWGVADLQAFFELKKYGNFPSSFSGFSVCIK